MELTLIIAISTVLCGLSLLVGFVGLLLVFAWFAMRSRGSKIPRDTTATPANASEPAPPTGGIEQTDSTPTALTSHRLPPTAPPPAPPKAPPRPAPRAGPLQTATPRPVDGRGTPIPAGATAPPPPEPPKGGGLIGFEEATDHTQTELFQRGAEPWEEEEEPSDTYDATEIFSAHGPAGDLAEFTADHRATPPGLSRRDKP